MSSKKIILKSNHILDKNTTQQEFLTILLKNRNLKKEDLGEFLNPTNPTSLSAKDFGVSQIQLNKAIKRIKYAIDNKENILIYGDYDVDGITSTAILWQSLTKIGGQVLPFVPDREHDGYGVKAASFLKFQEEKNTKFSLLITVDNGIVANKELQKIIDKNVDVIIVDHHLPSDNLPKANAIIHSTKVSGSALSWLLAFQFDSKADVGLAALGTVADCLPLIGINRNIVVHGLQSLQQNPSPGIKKLIEISDSSKNTPGRVLTTYDLGFVLGPRINAVGRLSNPTDALRLLCSQNAIQAGKYAQILDGFNQDRQTLQQDSIDLAEKKFVGKDVACNVSIGNKLIFIADSSFHPGIIGLIAGRLTEKYYLPSIIISIGPEVSKGSCRSIKELNIINILRQFSDLFIELGGHSGAAGFTIKTENIKKFQTKITNFINKKLKNIALQPSIIVEVEMKLSAATLKNHKCIKKLEPFGIDNQEPLFLFKNINVVQKRLIGNNNAHLKLKLDDPDTAKHENIPADAIAFKKGELDSQIKTGDKIDIIARLDSNTWQGTTTPQLVIKEIFP